MAEVFERVRKVICEQLSVTESEVAEDKRFQEDLNADSLDVVELIMALEEEFGIEIPDDDVANMKTVGDVTSYIEKKD
ncbi:MAG: acyl carrier protein [Armatimonadetes bacterium]|nr:acyl carrier protein [Armatimonadota bacterium]MBS1711233.1 acyl carrier protein [Armatimonadota bacterium]MBX3108907.1 acyl carrier protein [Fimbriimonadaceae bacterium]